MKAFDSTEDILKEIEKTGSYIWEPMNCNASNHVLGSALSDMADEGYLNEKDISTGFWIFENSKIKYTITEKGREFIKKTKK